MTKSQEAHQDTDAFAVWRQLYDANEKAWNSALEGAMGTPEFGESSGRLLETMLAAQKSVRDNMRAYLETMNVPTREDIARLGELVVGLEEKSDQIADRLDVLEDAVRSRPAEVAKIDRIAKRLDTIERAVRSRAADGARPATRAARPAAVNEASAVAPARPGRPAAKAATTAKPATTREGTVE